MSYILKNGTVFTGDCVFEKLDIEYGERVISAVEPRIDSSSAEAIDCSGCYVLPGLTDIHLHGCMGHDMCDGTADALDAISAYQFSRGVTSFCPATMTLPEDRITAILRASAEYNSSAQAQARAELLGINLEGPFISERKCGAQDPAYVQKPSAHKLRAWQKAANGLIKLVTIAPDAEGATELIESLSAEFHFSLGHTESDYETAARAFRAGADHVTHLFNAMPPFHHRDTGVIGAAAEISCYAELICDGIHVSPSAVRAAFKLFGDHRLVLISDSTEAAGMPEGEYSLGGQRVYKRSSTVTLEDGTLAGSASSLYDCLLKAVEIGVPLESAVRAATINPCRSIGADALYGSIEPGKRAHFLILDSDDLSIRRVI